MQTFTKVGLDALLTPENCVLLLIDHQPSQLANVNSHEPTMVINNVTGLAKVAKAYGVPTILTTISAGRGGKIFKQIQAVFPDQKPIDRTFMAGELQRDWARTERLGEVAQVLFEHAGASGTILGWELDNEAKCA